MMIDTRLKIAASLLIAVLSTLGASQASAAGTSAVRYRCDGHQNLVVVRSATAATVRFLDRTYELERRPSRLGAKYGSATAALIVDGASAVFVAEDRLQLGACVEAITLARLD